MGRLRAAALLFSAALPLWHDPPTGRGPSDMRGVHLRSPIRAPAWQRPRARLLDQSNPVVLPFLPDGVRTRGALAGHVLFFDWCRPTELLRVERLRISINGRTSMELALDVELHGEPIFGELQADLERLPSRLSQLRRRQRYFASPDVPIVNDTRAEEILERCVARSLELSAAWERTAARPFIELPFELDLSAAFPEDAEPGAIARVRFEFDYVLPDGQGARAYSERVLRFAGPRRALPEAWLPEQADAQLVVGDLHAHPCDSLSLCGQFTLAELLTQIAALDLDFSALPTGAACLEVRHAAQPLPSDAWPRFLDLADSGLDVHSSSANSVGVEVWNGDYRSGQDREAEPWIERMLAGDVVYAVAGSDTHHEAIDFGANHAIIGNELSSDAVLDALRNGRNFLSNDALLMIDASCGDLELAMGAVFEPGPDPALAPNTSLDVRVRYDVGQQPTAIWLFTGRTGGDAEQEQLLAPEVLGRGELHATVEFEFESGGYVRAYSESADFESIAYTNPIFLRPSIARQSTQD